MQTFPSDLPAKTPGEKVHVKLRLGFALGSDTITTTVWSSLPPGLAFSNPVITDAGKSVEADVSDGIAFQLYTVVATATMSSGVVREPWVRLPVEPAGT